jgi:hypothetical protein
MIRKFLKEPLLHFVLIGAVLFGAYAWRNRGAQNDAGGRQVRISESDVLWLKKTWAKQWQREPTREELRGLVTEFLKEELLAREAREMGLDQNDVFVRRRLAQKVEFMVQDTSRLAVPTEDDLRRFYAAHPERFSDPARVSFTHVYFSREQRQDAAADARTALTGLSHAPPDAGSADLGDRLLLDSEFGDVEQSAVAGLFGAKFASAVFALAPGAWHGPIESGYGLHLVRVSAQTPARPREFAQVRAQVLERWQDQRQREDNEKYFANLLKKYDVAVDASVKPLVGVLGETEVVP